MRNLTRVIATSIVVVAGYAYAQDKDKKAETKTQKVELAADLTAEAPADWKFQKPNRQFRTHEFTFPDPGKGSATGFMMITHFGKGGGGGLEANLDRWYAMVEQPGGGSTEKAAKKDTIELKGAAGKVVWLDMSGTYLDRPTPMSEQVTRRDNYRVFAAMIEAGKDGPYWIRAYGPESVMKAHRDGFERFLKSISKK
jgi:hypothetical protein